MTSRANANAWRAERNYELMPEIRGYCDHITPMVLLCGVFFPPEQLPPLVQSVANWLPLTHSVALVRPLLFGEIPGGIIAHLAALLAVALAAFWIALTLIRRRLLK